MVLMVRWLGTATGRKELVEKTGGRQLFVGEIDVFVGGRI